MQFERATIKADQSRRSRPKNDTDLCAPVAALEDSKRSARVMLLPPCSMVYRWCVCIPSRVGRSHYDNTAYSSYLTPPHLRLYLPPSTHPARSLATATNSTAGSATAGGSTKSTSSSSALHHPARRARSSPPSQRRTMSRRTSHPPPPSMRRTLQPSTTAAASGASGARCAAGCSPPTAGTASSGVSPSGCSPASSLVCARETIPQAGTWTTLG